MVEVPMVNALTLPDVLTVAIAGALLLHIPPVVTSDSVLVPPLHTVAVPVSGATTGGVFTVREEVAIAVPHTPDTE